MNEAATKLLEQVLALPRADQEMISARLLECLDGPPGEQVSEAEARKPGMPRSSPGWSGTTGGRRRPSPPTG
jgi:hypothetical protein